MSKTLEVTERIHNCEQETFTFRFSEGRWKLFCNGELIRTLDDDEVPTNIYMDGKLIYPK